MLRELGPSLGFWRAAEIAALREVHFVAPVLDLGCGDGFVTSFVLPSVAIGVDPDAKMTKMAWMRGLYARVEAAKIQNARIIESSMATVMSNSVLEHISDIDIVLSEVARILRPGGRLVFTVPSEYFSGSLALPFSVYGRRRNRRFTHINLWTVRDWEKHLRCAGMDLEFTRLYLHPSLVRIWDSLELMQQVHVYNRRLFGMVWKRLPASFFSTLAGCLSKIDFAADAPAGGRLMVAVKRRSFVPSWNPSVH